VLGFLPLALQDVLDALLGISGSLSRRPVQ
jgi:hypothetical protein